MDLDILMASYEDYYIVEYRYAVKVPANNSNKNTPMLAVSTANSICERTHGFRPNNWFARVFKYSSKDGVPGVDKEYFYNPHGVTIREVDANWLDHEEILKNNLEKENENE
tara:strand:- start:6998 stop:7330 length:333 start_codon:yes stop_codon:yes gene_type:complete